MNTYTLIIRTRAGWYTDWEEDEYTISLQGEPMAGDIIELEDESLPEEVEVVERRWVYDQLVLVAQEPEQLGMVPAHG